MTDSEKRCSAQQQQLDWTGRLEEKQQNAPRPKTAATETSSERERRNKSKYELKY
jgi:hypothetical protein